MSDPLRPEESFALQMDAADPLSRFRERFGLPFGPGGTPLVYLCGHSLGLQPKGAAALVEQELEDWARLGVSGHFQARHPWYSYHEAFREPVARLVGALPHEVVLMNSLTMNLHLMMVTFYRPTPERHAVLVEEAAFPSDVYAVRSQIRHHGFDPEEALVLARAREGESTPRTEDIEDLLQQYGRDIALVLLGGVNYYTGQAFDLPRIAAAARGQGCVVGLDLAHAAGNVVLRLHEWDVDFAAWCSYKYLNGGPGAVAGCFVHERHGRRPDLPRFAGWWGTDPATRFRIPIEPEFHPRDGADGWQVSNPPILSLAPLRASLALFDEAGMEALRARSMRMAEYLDFLLGRIGGGHFESLTPRHPEARGCQVSLRVRGPAEDLFRRLGEQGIVCDARGSDVLRVAPVPLYNTFHDVWRFARELGDWAGPSGGRGAGGVSGDRILIVGGGLGGALMAIYLGRAGHAVEVYERRPDPRIGPAGGGRSINLAISTRGIDALERAGLARRILDMAVSMRGRMIHAQGGALAFQPYGVSEAQAINSVSREGLNRMLVEAAAELPGVRFSFNRRCTGLDLAAGRVSFRDTAAGGEEAIETDVIIGADGAYSEVRAAMQRLDRYDYSQAYLDHGYKELSIPPASDGGFRMERDALHIWPRGGFMMIALPNRDGSFTCTCFWPFAGPAGFDSLRTGEDVRRYFGEVFPDAAPLMPTLAEDYFRNPLGSLVTIRCRPWRAGGRAVLIGDAAHAIVPFYGQGANAAFEDCDVLDECIREHAPDWESAFTRFEARRREHTDALADLAVQNFIEMRDKTASRLFLFGKKVEKGLHLLFPRWFVPLYFMVTFSRTPYADAVRRARRQWRVVKAATAAALLALLLLAVLNWG